ncbi:MAG: NAD-dependent epimerase/dehydratase family protein [Culicoidibacterales bacterium]
MKKLHVIIGAGPVGRNVMNKLSEKNEQVRIINTKGIATSKATSVKADILDYKQLLKACEGADVIYFCSSPPYTEWDKLFSVYAKNVIDVCTELKAKLVYADNLYMYGQVVQMSEKSAYAATTKKGKIRATVANQIMSAHNAGLIKATIARSSDFYGPEVQTSMVGKAVFQAALAGKKVQLLGNTDLLHSLTYIEDFAKALIILGESEEAFGEIWHVPNAPTITCNQFMKKVELQIGVSIKSMNASKGMITFAGLFSKPTRELVEMFYMYDKPFVASHKQFDKHFTMPVTTFDEGIKKTIKWVKGL